MTEIVARLPRARGLAPALLVLAATVAFAAAAAVALRPHAKLRLRPVARAHAAHASAPRPAEAATRPRPERAPAPLPTATLEAAAARSFGRALFFRPGGIERIAGRVEGWRRLAVRAAGDSDVDPNLLEALVLVESGGLAGATADDRAGLTQLTPAAARRAGLHVDADASRRLSREIVWWVRHGNRRVARRLAIRRAHADARFAPLTELRATVRTLEHARAVLGRTDLALASYHLGVSGLRGTVRRYGGRDVSYADLYFGSGLDRHDGVYRRLRAHGEAAYDYVWNVLAAQRALWLYRAHYGRLVWEDRQQHRKLSAEEVLHPRAVSHEFRTPAALARAWRRHVLVRMPRDAARTHLVVAPLGTLMGRRHRLYAGLRPGARTVLLQLAHRVHTLAGGPPLHLTSAVRDDVYQRRLTGVNAFAARTYSLHTTGWTFDVGRATLTSRQLRALRWELDRLTAMNLVAYIEEPYCFHVTVASSVVSERGLLRRAA